MPRSLSTAALTSVLAEQTEKVWLATLEITHDDLDPPIRLANNTEDVTIGGNTYTAYPFIVRLPDDDPENLARVTIQIDNVDLSLMTMLRTLRGYPDITLSIILADSPNTTEAGPFAFKLKSARYNKHTIRGELSYEDILNEPAAYRRFTPELFQGMFQ